MLKNSIKTGDLFALGQHRLLYGDATSPESVSKLIDDKKINLLLTDPPYGVAVVESKRSFGGSHRPIENDHIQSDEEYRTFSQKWLAAVKPHLFPKNSFYIFNSDRLVFALKDALDQENFKLSQLLVWLKTGAVIGRLNYLPQHELIAYGWFGRHEFIRSQDKSVLICPKTQRNNLHPTMKPVPLLRRLILNSSKRNDIILDPFGGSGSTLIACEQLQRSCFMIEIDPNYCQTIMDRFEKTTGKKINFIRNVS